MLHDTCQEPIGLTAESQPVSRIFEYIFSVLIQGHIDVHAGTVHLGLWLWHKRGVKAVALGDGPHRHLEGHQLVRRLHHIRHGKINLMLSRGNLMMGRSHFISHLLQSQHNVSPCVFSQVHRT